MGLRICMEKHKECSIFEEVGKAKGELLRCPLCVALEMIEELQKKLAKKEAEK